MKCKKCGVECNQGRGSRYCSTECSHVKTKCDACSKDLSIPNGRYSMSVEHFCSKKCFNAHKKTLVGDKNPFYGKHHTKESRDKIAKDRDYSTYKTQEFRDKMSDITKGKSNKHKGKSMYNRYIELHGDVDGQLKYNDRMEQLKLYASGENNPMFGKPSPTGSGNGWSGWYKGWYFRSVRELSYMINVIERFDIQWKTGDCSKTKIPYTDFSGTPRNYFPDFVLNDVYIIEIKPKKLWGSDLVSRKTLAAKQWCVDNGYIYKIIDPKPLALDRVRELYLAGVVKFLPRYEEKFKRKFLDV